jgi:hypothetical protein
VVTISVPLGRPFAGRGGGGGAAGRWAAVTLRCAAAAGAFLAAARDLVAAFGFALAGFADADFAAFGFAGSVRGVATARRWPPSRVGRVDRRLPSTLGFAAAFAVFFEFFLEDFCVMDTVIGRRGRRPALTSKNIAPRLTLLGSCSPALLRVRERSIQAVYAKNPVAPAGRRREQDFNVCR